MARYPWHDYGARWERVRDQVLAESPFCECSGCGPRCCGGQARAREVDHIVELRDGGTHARPNLRSMCSSCHRKKTHEARRRRG